MNLPFTMTPDLARSMRPKVLYPYHFGETDTAKLVVMFAAEKDMEARVRPLQ